MLGFMFSLGVNSCSLTGDDQENTELVNLRVNHFQQTAIGLFPTLVLLVQEGDEVGSSEWQFFYDTIEGFNYQPGFVYNLKVKKETLENPPQDGSSIKSTLMNISSKDKVPDGESFDIRLKWGGENFVNGIGTTELTLLQEYKINCTDLCEELMLELENSEQVTGSFSHEENKKLKLISIQ
ncbi:MAG: DUF4377 domain-containing protein [Gramella sp.]|nr:DUF4377 domain-containing protein [Christiangramia sp.]